MTSSIFAILVVVIYRVAKIEMRWEEVVIVSFAVIPRLPFIVESFKLSKDGVDVTFLKNAVENLQTGLQETKAKTEENESKIVQVENTAQAASDVVFGGVGKLLEDAQMIAI